MVLSQKPFRSRFSCLLSDKALAKIKEICLRQVLTVERLSIMFTSNGKANLYHVTKFPPLIAVYCSFSTYKLVVSPNFFNSIRIVLSCFYLLTFCFEIFST